MIRLASVTLLFLLLVAFFLQNQEEQVTIHYVFGLQSATTPVYKPVLGAFVAGLLIASLVFLPTWVRTRVQLRRTTRALQEAEAELERLRVTGTPPVGFGTETETERTRL